MEQILGWIGNLGFLLGAIWLARKNVLGFYFQIIANILYIIQSILLNNNSLFWLSIILCVINGYGIYTWKHLKKEL